MAAAKLPDMKGLVGLLFLVGLVAVYWKWILAVAIIVLIVRAAPIAYQQWQADRSAERARLSGIIARADQQHAWAMAGDPRGTYGHTDLA
jgi:hypothetical protein